VASVFTFNGQAIFGGQNRQGGPWRPYRAQEEQLPGVDGCRIYRLGKGSQFWTVRGRLLALTLPALNAAIRAGQSLVDGNIYTFVDNGGASHTNCMMTDYRPAGPFEPVSVGFSVEITAAVQQISPDN
jgi:hypothetical protein